MIGTIILAAGLGRRLGHGPKALVKIAGKTLLAHLIEKSSDRVIVLTSKGTHKAIEGELARQGITHVDLVEMPSVPSTLNPDLYIPIGNGALFQSVGHSPFFQRWLNQGVTHISIVPIDNPLANPLDPEMFEGDLVAKGVPKTSPYEKMGSLLMQGNQIKVIEYSELTEEEKTLYTIGYTGSVAMTTLFFLEASSIQLPWHQVERNGEVHQEKFIFDAFFLAKSPKIVISERKGSFCPIKIETDIAVAEKLLYNNGLLKQS